MNKSLLIIEKMTTFAEKLRNNESYYKDFKREVPRISESLF